MHVARTLWIVYLFLAVQAARFKKTSHPKPAKAPGPIRRTTSNSGLWPPSFNLATKADISANATCGENGREEFCRMMEGGRARCGVCDSYSTDSHKKHPIHYAIDGSNRWWQSPALFYGAQYEHITITIDLKQVYQISDVILKAANSLRPGSWVLERSLDGTDYQVWQYFARSDKECQDRFGVASTKGKPHYFTDSEVICTSFYSKLTPTENGEIHTSLVNGRPGVEEVSPELLEFTKARFVRLRLMGLRSAVEPLPRWFSQDTLREKKMYYTIRDISIIGYCVCNGHAENCRHNVASGHPECECAHHTCGSNCNQCCPMYNQRSWGPGTSRDAHQCLPCNCHGHATSCHYEEDVDKAGLSLDIFGNYQGGGVCDNCTAYTTGINCEKCHQGYYRPPGVHIFADKPCVKCPCDSPGSTGSCILEGAEAGKCECHPGFEGTRCELCSSGFKGWPNCESCLCDQKGVVQGYDCERECNCKANVFGAFCEKCKPGYFAISLENPEGCTKCYCSGVTTICESAELQPETISTLDGWLTSDFQMTHLVKPIMDNKGLFSIGNYELPNTAILYWLAPESYLGNKLEYYDSILKFKVHWVVMRGDTSGRPTTGPIVILVGKKGGKIGFGSECYTSSNETFEIQMRENDFYHIVGKVDDFASTYSEDNKYVGGPVSRTEFLAILSDLKHILLRATYHSDQLESLLEEVTLYSDDSEIVEKCLCPSGYTGLSCETCAYGYVRIIPNASLELEGNGYCGKCDCNGHSQTCDATSGECFCEHDTMGENCDRCKPGYYGNPLKGTPLDCKKCACPLESDDNNFSPSCQLDETKDDRKDYYVCTQCPKGYTGDHCEICDDGYFGDPTSIGDTCKPCNCNGGPCDKITGQCLRCEGNTEGWRCEKCKSGYFGNALTSSCVSCQCDPFGSVSGVCNVETGQCECKDRFTGRTCNKCEVGYGNVTAFCVPCVCNTTGSLSNVCDQHTGLCECKKGIDGFHCDACQNLHFGFSEDGCKECSCNKEGSSIQACDQLTGRCRCKPNYEGEKCDRCKAGFWNSSSTCIPCNCDANGSQSQNCARDTGICECKKGVEGRRCDSCKSKFYGAVATGCKECDPCDKPGHVCDPLTGRCVCPRLTVGESCERCAVNAWGYEPGIGCKPCECSESGSTSLQCESFKGRCTCKKGFEGEKCNKCSFGYYHPTSNSSDCVECHCYVPGTQVEECNRGTCKCSAQGCKCKGNVEGQRCNSCKKGTFGIHSDHRLGCVECFCSGRSKTCSMANYIWHQSRTNVAKRNSRSECLEQVHCWSLPESFGGDLVTSYGGHLRISSNAQRFSVYLTGNGVVFEALGHVTHEIKLTEFHWRIKQNLNPVRLPKECTQFLTRPCFLVGLQNVTKIQIVPDSSNFKLKEALLDKAAEPTGHVSPQTRLVENCTCPEEYTSSSCQNPNLGYYRYRPPLVEQRHPQITPKYTYIDRIMGVARPCQCNNRSKVCNTTTGFCLNCQNFTTGPHCENCAKGYYKNAKGDCAPCLCPSATQNFADSCDIDKSGDFYCNCKVGYSGKKCGGCDDNFWGNPQKGGVCRPCNCNVNGSLNLQCDKKSGQCQCQSGFIGLTCSNCQEGRQVIQNGVCQPCDECAQILFNTVDEISGFLQNASTLFEGGLGPPWGKLTDLANNYRLYLKQAKDLQKLQVFVKNANVSSFEDRLDSIQRNLSRFNVILNNQTSVSEQLNKESAKVSEHVKKLENNIMRVILNIDKFGKSYVNIDDAIFKAKDLMRDIAHISREFPRSEFYNNFFEKCQNMYQEVNEVYKGGLETDRIRKDIANLRNRFKSLMHESGRTERQNQLAETKNKHNSNRLKTLKRSIDSLNQNYSRLEEDTRGQLLKINLTDTILRDIKNIYEVLSDISVSDATKQNAGDLEEMYKNLGKVRAKITDLKREIERYNKIFNFTKEEWSKIDASGAFNNIVKLMKEANENAEKARNITLDALKTIYPKDNDSLPDRTNLAKAFSDRLHKRGKNLENITNDFKRLSDEVDNLKYSILINGKSNNELNSFLRNMRENITNHAKDLERLQKAKQDARNVSGLVNSIEKLLQDTNITVQYELVKPYQRYLNLTSCAEIENFNRTLNDTEKYLDKVNQLKNKSFNDTTKCRFNESEAQLRNISKKIEELKAKIQYANDRVKSIEYGLNVNTCKHSFKLKSDVFRSMEIQFKCDSCSLINLVKNGVSNILITYKNQNVVVRWRNITVKLHADGVLTINKIGPVVKLTTDLSSKVIEDSQPLLIDEEHLLYVGNLTLNGNSTINGNSAINSTSSNEACVNKIKINGETLGLWKFHTSEGSCTGCYRNNKNDDGLINVFFNGEAYRNVTSQVRSLKPKQLNFILTFTTFDENSLLFLAQASKDCSFIAVNLKDGKVVLTVQQTDGQRIQLGSKQKYNNGIETKVDIAMAYENSTQTQKYALKVTLLSNETNDEPNNEKDAILSFKDIFKIRLAKIFVGGIPATVNTACLDVNTTGFLGNLKVEGSLVVKNENSFSVNIENPLKSLNFIKAWFPGYGFLSLEHEAKNSVDLNFTVKLPDSHDGHIVSINEKLHLYIKNAALVLRRQGEEEINVSSVCANQIYFVSFTSTRVVVNSDVRNVSLDELHVQKKLKLRFGEAKDSGHIKSFVGGISDIFVNNLPLFFNTTTVKTFKGVEIGRDRQLSSKGCSTNTQPEMMGTERYFNLPDHKTEPQAFKFGDKPNSFVLLKNINAGKKFFLEFQFRTFYPNGLLFASTANNSTQYTVLELQGGNVKLHVQGHRNKLMSPHKILNDGQWHEIRVEQILGKRKLRLVIKIDKKWKIKERLLTSSFDGDIHFGSFGTDLGVYKTKDALHPFRGCIGSLKINKNLQIVKNNNNIMYNNIGQCFQHVQEGAYFGGDAFAIYRHNFKLQSFLGLSFDFKTSQSHGILLTISNPGNSPSLSVELQNGAVVMTVDMGNGVISTVTNSPQTGSRFVDNQWHNVTTLYSSSELTVNVDGIRKSWVQSQDNSMSEEIEAPLYIGGLPSNAPSGTLKIKENFKGCLRKLKIEDTKLDWTDMMELSNVQLNSCLA